MNIIQEVDEKSHEMSSEFLHSCVFLKHKEEIKIITKNSQLKDLSNKQWEIEEMPLELEEGIESNLDTINLLHST